MLQSSSSQSGDTTLTMTTTELGLASAEDTGTAKFIYNGDGMNLNLTPAVAAIIVGVLCKLNFNRQSAASFSRNDYVLHKIKIYIST